MFLRDIGPVTRLKLLLTVALGLLPALFPRMVCLDTADLRFCWSTHFAELAGFVIQTGNELAHAAGLLQQISRPIARLFDIGHAYLAVCLLMPAIPGSRGHSSHRTAGYWISVAAMGAYVLWYALEQFAAMRFASIAGDLFSMMVYAWFAIAVYREHDHGSTALQRLRRWLVTLLLIVQATGIMCLHGGMGAIPNRSFALLLAAANIVAPPQLLLLLVTSYNWPRRALNDSGAHK